MRFAILFLFAYASLAGPLPEQAISDGPADNRAENVRPVPPSGIKIPEERRQALEAELEVLAKQIAELAASKEALIVEYLPDVEIFHRAVRLALHEDGFFEPNDIDRAFELVKEGRTRADSLQGKSTPWRSVVNGTPFATVRGFRSKLDGTVQPYGVVFNMPGTGRADVWCRGRSEKGLELQFLASRMKNTDPLPEPGTMMIHPFGRYCNANKLAGEIDTLEAIEHATREYGIDPKRVAIRGFSMGGAAAWHLAVHYPDRWFAATPGAGFSETPDFLKVFQSESLEPTWFERKLWQMYDCPVWARNLRMLPTIAYSGELDKQKQAADVMAKACWELPEGERFELAHIIAPKTAHQITTEARRQIERRLRQLDAQRSEKSPDAFSFTTCSLRYNKAHWLTVDALEEHWVPSTIHVGRENGVVSIRVDPGIQQFTLDMEPEELPASYDKIEVVIRSEDRTGAKAIEWLRGDKRIPRRSDRSWGATFRIVDGKWTHVSPLESAATGLRKKHLLQGPVDDAFMAPFLFVRPSGQGMHPDTHRWVQDEFDRAVREWHRQMRGDARIKSSEELTPEDIQNYNLVLWGDPASNSTLAKLLGQLPIQWSQESLTIGGRTADARSHIPILIYPNPLAPERYVVLNSGFTYREYDYLNNARQVPKLPDWAVVDVSTPPNSRWPGRIVDADFFDEAWKIKRR